MRVVIQPDNINYKKEYYRIIDLFCNGETGIADAIYEIYKPIMIYYKENIYVYDQDRALWILQKQKEKVFALATLYILYLQLYNLLLNDLYYNYNLAKNLGLKQDEKLFNDKIVQLNKITFSFGSLKTKTVVARFITAYLANNSDPKFIGFDQMPNILAIPENKILDLTTGLIYPREIYHYCSVEHDSYYIPKLNNTVNTNLNEAQTQIQIHPPKNPLESFIAEYIDIPENLPKKDWLPYSEFKIYYQRYCKNIDEKYESDKRVGTYLKSKYLFAEGGNRKYAFQFKDKEKLMLDFPDE